MSILTKPLGNLALRWIHDLFGLHARPRHPGRSEAQEAALTRSSSATGDVIGYIRAWRVWGLSQVGGELRLTSPLAGLCWRPGLPMKGWPALQPHGIYALDHAEDARTMRRRWLGGQAALLGGEIALWGDVREHERGWRAQFAYPVSLTWLATYCDRCGKLVGTASAGSGQAAGFVKRIDRDEFVMLCRTCGSHQHSIHPTDNGEWLRDGESVLGALRQTYLPYLIDACEASRHAASLGARVWGETGEIS